MGNVYNPQAISVPKEYANLELELLYEYTGTTEKYLTDFDVKGANLILVEYDWYLSDLGYGSYAIAVESPMEQIFGMGSSQGIEQIYYKFYNGKYSDIKRTGHYANTGAVKRIFAIRGVKDPNDVWKTYVNNGYTIKYNVKQRLMYIRGRRSNPQTTVNGAMLMTGIPEEITPETNMDLGYLISFTPVNGAQYGAVADGHVSILTDGTMVAYAAQNSPYNEPLPITRTICIDGWNSYTT